MPSFKAIVDEKADGGQKVGLVDFDERDLMEGDVTVRVAHSTVNYKDGLAVTGKAPVVRRFPMIAGIDFAGTVEHSSHPEWKAGEYTSEPSAGLRTAADLLMIAGSAPPLNQKDMPTREAVDQYLARQLPTRIAALDANMLAPIELIKATVDAMAARGFGRVVNITSLSIYMPIPGLDISSGARAGLTAFMAGVARSVAGANVTINFMQPGAFATDRLQSNIETTAAKRGITVEQATRERLATIPAKRFGTPEEFGAACAFLCSAQAGFITGQNLLIDGGTFPGAF